MDQEIHNCHEIGTKPISFFFQEGSGNNGKKVLILGESLAKNGWVESGKAFYTKEGKMVPTGKRLNDELALLNIKLEDCAFTEIAKCYIGKNRKQLSVCGSLCTDHFMQQVYHYRPSLIVSLGVVTKDLLNSAFGIELMMGEITEVAYKNREYKVLPLYHPSPANPFGHVKNIKIIEANRDILISILK